MFNISNENNIFLELYCCNGRELSGLGWQRILIFIYYICMCYDYERTLIVFAGTLEKVILKWNKMYIHAVIPRCSCILYSIGT